MIEACMIGLRERQHELASALITSIDANTSIPDVLRVHERDQLEEQIGLRFEEIRSFPLHSCLEALRVIAGNAVPGLGLPPVH